jgi:hypothetical protein
MKCPKYQTENPDTQSFCGDCGTQLGLPKELCAIDHRITSLQGREPFRSMPDGEHFLVKRYSSAEETAPLTLVQNWTRLLDQN